VKKYFAVKKKGITFAPAFVKKSATVFENIP